MGWKIYVYYIYQPLGVVRRRFARACEHQRFLAALGISWNMERGVPAEFVNILTTYYVTREILKRTHGKLALNVKQYKVAAAL